MRKCKNAIILSAITLILLLAGCAGGAIESQSDNAAVSDTDETENGMAGTERNVEIGRAHV